VSADDDLDTTKVVVLTTIIVLTVLGNVAVILAIVCRKMKMNRSEISDHFRDQCFAYKFRVFWPIRKW
jgi:hypothetical protein